MLQLSARSYQNATNVVNPIDFGSGILGLSGRLPKRSIFDVKLFNAHRANLSNMHIPKRRPPGVGHCMMRLFIRI